MSSPPPSSGRGLAAALQVLPDPVAIFDADWTICHLNLVGALLDRPAAELIGRNIWGSRSPSSAAPSSTTQQGRIGDLVGLLPAGRPLAFATAVVIDGLLQVSARTVDDRRAERPEDAGKSVEADENADRLRSSGRGL